MEKREQIIELLNNCIIGESVSNTADAILLLFSVSNRKIQQTYDCGYEDGYQDGAVGRDKRKDLGIYDC
jgi:hypothetical protein